MGDRPFSEYPLLSHVGPGMFKIDLPSSICGFSRPRPLTAEQGQLSGSSTRTRPDTLFTEHPAAPWPTGLGLVGRKPWPSTRIQQAEKKTMASEKKDTPHSRVIGEALLPTDGQVRCPRKAGPGPMRLPNCSGCKHNKGLGFPRVVRRRYS